jgi:hypothetical protein
MGALRTAPRAPNICHWRVQTTCCPAWLVAAVLASRHQDVKIPCRVALKEEKLAFFNRPENAFFGK